MKAKIIFDLPEEQKDFLRAVKALDLGLALWETEQLFRKHGKFAGQGEEFYDILDKYNIDLEELAE